MDAVLQLQLAAASYIFIHHQILSKKKRKSPRWWISKLYQSRKIYSGSNLLADLKFQHINGLYKNFTRMHPTDFEFLLNSIGLSISKQNTRFRESISVQERLAVTLRFLATGDSYASLQYLFKISKQSISRIIPEVCDAIINTLKEYIKIPKTQEEWLNVTKGFETTWNFPHCLGAIDGKHNIVLQCPINSGSEYIYYKGFFSIVLFAFVDAAYNFIFVDVGCQGRISDGGIFASTCLYKEIENKTLNVPHPTPLNEGVQEIPYFFLGDEAFAMSENLMKVYAGYHAKGSKQRVFNYRVCRARRVVENVFGIASAVFRVLRKPMLLKPETASTVVLTVSLLHNFLRRRPQSVALYTPLGTFDSEEPGIPANGAWRGMVSDECTSLLPLRNVPRRAKLDFIKTREELADYFLKEGKLEWQIQYA